VGVIERQEDDMDRARQSVFLVAAFLFSMGLQAAPARAAVPGPCVTHDAPGSAAVWLVCKPAAGWNGQAVLFAQGYVQPQLPLGFYYLTLADGTSIPGLVQALGFAFLTTTYPNNGVAILEGVDDLRALALATPALLGEPPSKIWLTGVSEGGLVAALSAERQPTLYHGAYATCGPIGNFRYQINHIGDFRVLFDYFFPGIIPWSPVNVPPGVEGVWQTIVWPAALDALMANPARAVELLKVGRVPFDPADPAGTAATVKSLLEYNVFGSADANVSLGGQPFDNRLRWYSGSSNDLLLNFKVRRFAADPAALVEMRKYTTTGDLAIPLVTLHTTGDGIVPFAHELIYALKAHPSGHGSFLPLPLRRVGHCSFNAAEVLVGFGLMVAQ
jgi:hypothetical protein